MNVLLVQDLIGSKLHFSRKNLNTNFLNAWIEQVSSVEREMRGHYLWLKAPEQKGNNDDYVTASALADFASAERADEIAVAEINF